MLATGINYTDPLFWALAIGWILSVVLHEFAHGAVAAIGGDYTVRQRGGLTLNPFQYIDPVMSLLLPAFFLIVGGVPLPGGATYIRRDLLRSRVWESLVSLAGPTMNFLLFALLALCLNPRVGWVDPQVLPMDWTAAQKLAGAMAFLQLLAVLLNLLPIPPLDGFGIIAPLLPPSIEARVMRGPWALGLLIAIILVLPSFYRLAYVVMTPVMHPFGVNLTDLLIVTKLALYGSA